MKRKTVEPYIWLQEQEIAGRADCGCELVQAFDDGPKFYQCALHKAALDLLTQAQAYIEEVQADLGLEDNGINADLKDAIAKAKGVL